MHISKKKMDLLVRNDIRSRRFYEFQRVVTRLSSEFINMPLEKLDGAMQSAAALVCKYCDVFRSSIWKFDWKNHAANRLTGWDNDGEELKEILITPPLAGLEPMINWIWSGKVLYANDNDAIVRQHMFTFDKNPGCPFTVCIYPLKIESNVIGCITMFAKGHGRKLDKTQASMLRIFADMIANVIRRKERETELRIHYENDRLVLDSVSEGVVMLDRDGTIININRHLAEKYGDTVERLIGVNVLKQFPIIKYSVFLMNRKAKVLYTFDTGNPVHFEDEKDGLTFSNSCFPVRKNGSIYAVALFTNDITPQKKALAEATKRAEYQARLRVTTDFFTNISHEFKTPLTLLFNAQRLIEDNLRGDEFPSKERVNKYLGVMRQNTNRLLRLVGNLLDVTKLDSGFLQMHPQETDAAAWLATVVGSIEDYAEIRGIQVVYTIQPGIPPLRTDVDKLDRILLNLLSNAVKHTPRGGHIRVSLGSVGNSMLLSVEDDGEGIPDDRKDIIFDRFKQVNSSLTRASEGSGIGLALCKLLTELMGGRIWFDSQYGKGSVFYVELPVPEGADIQKTGYLDGMDIAHKAEMEFSDIL